MPDRAPEPGPRPAVGTQAPPPDADNSRGAIENTDMGAAILPASRRRRAVRSLEALVIFGLVASALAPGLRPGVLAATAVLCALMGYPPAYFIAMTAYRQKWLLLLRLIVPFWISFTIRTFSWIHILGEQGAINATLLWLGIIDRPLQMLYTEGSVIMGMIHFLLPYMILNVYVSLEGIDRNLISAARTLGCTSWQAFREVTLPLSLPGLGAGTLLCFVLAAGSYVTPHILGSNRDALFGNLIFDTIMSELNWPLGSTLSVVLLVLLGILSAIYSRYMGLSRMFRGLSR